VLNLWISLFFPSNFRPAALHGVGFEGITELLQILKQGACNGEEPPDPMRFPTGKSRPTWECVIMVIPNRVGFSWKVLNLMIIFIN